jgi:hypothetical protein
MDMARLNAILSGQRTLAAEATAKAVIIGDDESLACASSLGVLCSKSTGARPLPLDSSQLPPIF